MVKVSPDKFASDRVTAIRNEVKTGTWRLRKRVFSMLKKNLKAAPKWQEAK